MASVDRQRGLDTSEGHRTRECEWYSHEDGARHEGLRRYPCRRAMTCAETGGESKGRPKKRTPA